MKLNFKLKKIFEIFSLLFICIFIFIFQINTQILNALPMENDKSENIIEELRLQVPSKYKEEWLKVEKNVWEPWLSSQDGFLGRELFWDKEKEEALILVSWKSKELWKTIPMSEVNVVQEKFENNVKASLNLKENPFKLIYEGELDKQG